MTIRSLYSVPTTEPKTSLCQLEPSPANEQCTVRGTRLQAQFIVRWPGKVPAGKVENAIMSGLDWFPTFVAAAGNPNIVAELKQGKPLGDRTYKVHLDGYNQMDLITGKGPWHEVFYFTE